MKLTSSSFEEGQSIPPRFTCEGDNVSPPLSWTGAPEQTQSFALIVDDPDAPDPNAPQRTYVHWVLYDLPPETTRIPEGARELPEGTRQGVNDFGRAGYGGPCPPIGRHRYFFRLYALNARLGELPKPAKPDLEKAMREHILAEAVLMGTYGKGGS